MKRICAFALLLAAALLSCTAFAKDRLVVYTSFEDSDYRKPPLNRVIAAFERKHGISISFAKKTALSTDDHHEAYLRLLSSKSGAPDIMQIDGIRIPEFASMGYIVDLTDFFPKSEQAKFFKNSIQEATWNDRIWAYPYFVAFGFIIYRKDLVDVPPKTWAELIEVAREKQTKDLYGYVGQMARYEGLTCNALEFMWSSGGNPQFDRGGEIFSSRDARGLKLMVDIVNKHRITPPEQLNYKEHEGIQLLREGKVIFLRHWPLAMFKSGMAGKRHLKKYGVMPIPRGEGGAAGYSTLGDWTLAVNKNSKNVRKAVRLVQLLTSEAVQKQLALGLLRLPVRKSLYRDAQIVELYPWMQDVYRSLLTAKLRPRSQYYPEISRIMQGEVHLALEGKISPQKAIERVNKKIRAFMETAGR